MQSTQGHAELCDLIAGAGCALETVIPLLFFLLPFVSAVSACCVLGSTVPFGALIVPASSRSSVPFVSAVSAFLAAAAFFLAFFLADLERPASTYACVTMVLWQCASITYRPTSDWPVISESGFVSKPSVAILSCNCFAEAAEAVSVMTLFAVLLDGYSQCLQRRIYGTNSSIAPTMWVPHTR